MAEPKTIFKRILDKEISADLMYEDAECIAFRDISPQAPVHVLIIPRKEIRSIADARPDDQLLLGHLLLVAGKLAREFGLEDGFRVVTNTGESAGQTVDHLHLHLLGGRSLGWPPG